MIPCWDHGALPIRSASATLLSHYFLACLLLSTMLYLTIVIRWCCTPLDHINFITDNITKWYMNRWTYNDTRHLTVICIEIEPKGTTNYITQLVRLMQNLWVEPNVNVMECGNVDTLLGNKNALGVVSNTYSVTHTDSRPGLSFYKHLSNTVALVKGYDWTIRKGSTVADKLTNMKLHCQHEPHCVTVVLTGSSTKMITVQCQQPQRIYDLMKTYGIRCSNVWDSNIALSAMAPCTALIDHNMMLIYADMVPHTDNICQDTNVDTFYHNMKYITIKTKGRVLRHRPYTMPLRKSVHLPPQPTSRTNTISGDSLSESIPLALYYSDQWARLNTVMESDGRFVSNVQCVSPHYVSKDTCMVEIESDQNVVLTAPDDNDDLDDIYRTPFSCLCCLEMSNRYLTCGHIMCLQCIRRIKKDGVLQCPMCRKQSTCDRPLIGVPDFVFTCHACSSKKDWVGDCGHVTCRCCSTCSECSTSFTKLSKLYTVV
ncbi:uncharacterized protein LOC118952224 isoform X2 [Oncorhynchus mykiss]|uniref:uncharacterized protein LOC118952224 isoform X2 n=1 Tax=Oncorhynchus mykiss TaxID=8022 RepID=UPI001878E096|nr:uncharacterized protein LOC118952224 isoform X2 [Oncorhynchus mykiss]